MADDFNSVPDVFLFDRLTQHYERISEPPDGGEANDRSGAPAITPDGRYVAFISSADNLASGSNETESVFVYDRIGGTMERVSGWAAGEAGLLDTGIPPAISVDGRVVSYLAEDTGGTQGVYLRDRVSGTTIRLGVTGPTSPPDFSTNSWLTMSGDGRRFAFGLFGDTESVFVFDRNTATTALVSAAVTGGSADGDSIAARMSRDGRAVVFVSNATNLVPSGPDGFVMNVFLATPNPPVCQRGDVNGDGSVDAADIPALIRSIFGGA